MYFHVPITTRSTPESAHKRFYESGLTHADGILRSVRREVETFEVDDISIAASPAADPVATVLQLCRRFPRAARQLTARHAGRAGITQTDEYDVQDVLHAFLHLHFDDVRTEEWTASYASSSARMDLLLKAERIVVEVKRTRDKLGNKQAKEQLAIDIDHYRVHPDCGVLVCFVYDPDGHIKNPIGFERDLEGARTEALDVRVVVAPHS